MKTGQVTAEVRERNKWITKRLRSGALPKNVIDEVAEKYNLAPEYAEIIVYQCNKKIKESLQDLYDNAAEYLVNNLQSLAEDALNDKDRKAAMKAYELLAKITKVSSDENKMDVNINFGFSFDDDIPTPDNG